MSTRACYSFLALDSDPVEVYHVYKHHDGYPTGAAQWIESAKKNAWELPRFEADEFAAAFIVANKEHAGDLRLTAGPKAHGDLSYCYEISMQEDKLWVKAISGNSTDGGTIIYDGPQSEFKKWADQEDAA